MAEKEIEIEIKNPLFLLTLSFLLLVFILELMVTFSLPVNFGDEGTHASIVRYMVRNIEYPVWNPFGFTNPKFIKYSWNRPPLLHLLTSGFAIVFGNIDFWVRFLSPFVSFLTGLMIYLLMRKVYNSEMGFFSSIITITTPSLVTYAVLFYTDVLLTFFVSFSILSFILARKKNEKKYFILSAVTGSLAFLSKLPGFAIYFFFTILALYDIILKRKFKIIKQYSLILLFLLLISSGYFIRNMYYFKTPLCSLPPVKILYEIMNTKGCTIINFKSSYKFSGRTEQVGTEQGVFKMGLMNYLSFAYGNPFFLILSFLCGLFLLIKKKDDSSIIILLYFIFFLLLFPVVTTRAEDTARYTLGWIFIFSIIASFFFEELAKFGRKYSPFLPLMIFFIVLLLSYLNFKSKVDTMSMVKRFSPSFFEACDWVRRNLPGNAKLMTIWAARALYNCERDAITQLADISLSRDLNYTFQIINKSGITHIFIQKFSIDPYNRHLGEKYDASFVQFLEDHPEHFKLLYENGVNLNITNRNVAEYIRYCIRNFGTVCDGNLIYEVVF